ncbi:MAG: hypothetical protein WBQ55_07025, partial [Xanthobacteraceae bacterium]
GGRSTIVLSIEDLRTVGGARSVARARLEYSSLSLPPPPLSIDRQLSWLFSKGINPYGNPGDNPESLEKVST